MYVDVQNIYFSYKPRRIDYEVLKKFIEERFKDVMVTFHAFTAYEEGQKEQMSFLNALALMGYRVVSKPVKTLPDGSKKGNLDMEIALEVLSQAPYIDEIVLVTGDGDFVPLVSRLSMMGKKITIMGPEETTAPDLIRACHEFVSLGQVQGLLR